MIILENLSIMKKVTYNKASSTTFTFFFFFYFSFEINLEILTVYYYCTHKLPSLLSIHFATI